METTPVNTKLMDILNFSAADLAANQAGRLSEAQSARLRRIWRRTLAIIVGLVLAVGLTATILLFVAQTNGSAILNFIGIALTVINAVIVGLGAQSYLRTSGDLRAGQVAAVSGPVSRTIRMAGRSATYVLKVDGQELIVAKPLFGLIEDGKPYRFYRAPASRTLLAAEAL